MKPPKVFITRHLFPESLDLVKPLAELRVWEEREPPPYELLKREAQEADGLLCLLTDKVDEGLFQEARRLRVVSNMAVGTDNIDVAAATRRGIYVGHTPGVLTETTADFTVGLLLAAARKVVESDRFIRTGQWKTWGPLDFLGLDVHGASLGILGLGRIGLAVAKRATGFNMQVLYLSRTRKPEPELGLGLTYVPDLKQLLRQSDFVTLHLPLTQETRHFIGKEELGAMKPTAILINTSRGSLIDPEALFVALRDRRITAAALDVTDPEPLPPDHPLLTLDNLIVTPHISSASIATRKKMAMMAATNLVDGLLGRVPSYCVNPEARQGGQPG